MLGSRWVLAPLLLGLALYSWWLSRDQAPQTRKESDDRPDYYAENLTTIDMDERGRPKQRLVARRMEHFAHDNSMHLQRPYLVLFEEGLPPWTLRSETGWIAGERDEAWLRGQVFIDREADGANPPYHMVTSELHVKREPDYAETDRPVFLVTDKEQVEAVGMQAWFEPETRIKLLSRVRGRFEQDD
jgi:lipopolysaccharide export system protein LptC